MFSYSCQIPVSEYIAETIFSTLHLTGNFPSSSDVYAGALGSGLRLLSPSMLEIDKISVSAVGYSKPLLSLSLWTRISVTIPDDHDNGLKYDWRWLGPLIAIITALIIAAITVPAITVILLYCYKKKCCFKHEEQDRQTLIKEVAKNSNY